MDEAGSPQRPTPRLPPWEAEDHVCTACGLAYAGLSTDEAARLVAGVPESLRAAVTAVPAEHWRRRPDTGGWSVAEYACHVRDVYATYTIRLHRARTEDRPVLEPMLNDLRARRFRYNDWDVTAVLAEVAATSAGFLAELARVRPGDWARVVVRRPGEQRTARWLARQAAHEGVHHVADVGRVGRLVAG